MENLFQYRRRRLFIPVILLLLPVFWLLMRNHPDPEWLNARRLLNHEHLMLETALDSVESLFRTFHTNWPDGKLKDSVGFHLLSDPFLPTMRWSKFRYYFDKITSKKFVVVASVNGSGATTVTDRLLKFISVKSDNQLIIRCAPQFDLFLHEKYIGREENGQFISGELLRFWKRCLQNPNEKFVCQIDNLDKINPETFFGPELWELLDEPKNNFTPGGEKVIIPPNFYLISVIHAGVSSNIQLTNQHFRRLGELLILKPEPEELVVYLRHQRKQAENTLRTSNDADALTEAKLRLASLNDTAHLTRFLFFFIKANALIAQRYSVNHQLGQWSNARKFYKKEDFDDLRNLFLNHINALEPSRPLTEADFSGIDYTLKNNGLEPGSNWLAKGIQFLEDTGYFVEITIVLATSIITALAGWWLFRRRESLLRQYGERTRIIFEDFESSTLTAEEASQQLDQVKREVDALVLKRKLNYTEALYFLGYIEDKAARIEYARISTGNFLDLMETYLEDGVLSEKEYQRLKNVLESIRHKIPSSSFQKYLDDVERLYRENNAQKEK